MRFALIVATYNGSYRTIYRSIAIRASRQTFIFALSPFATRYAATLIDRISFRPGIPETRHYSRTVKSANESERFLCV